LDEIELILADMLGPKAVRWGPKVLRKVGDTAEIAIDSLGRIVAQVQIVVHPLAQGRHGGTYRHHGPTPSVDKDSRLGVVAVPHTSRRSIVQESVIDSQSHSVMGGGLGRRGFYRGAV